MKSILNTKPTYTETVASRNGWIDPVTGEMIVAVTGLYDKILIELKEVQSQMAIMEANGENVNEQN